MPGIVGLICKEPRVPRHAESQVEQMLNVMRHEPRYVYGRYNFREMGIYAGWIAHPGSFASNQIFRDEQRKVTLLFSGECFLDPETNASLKRRGYAINPTAGNWLIPLYLEQNDGFFEQLNGLFSGLLIDEGRRRAFLFNDRYGMERLYWHENDDAFYFASEAKSLLRILPELREFDKKGIIDYLRFGCTIHSRTLFKGVESLPPGSLCSFESGRCKRGKYFNFRKWEMEAIESPSAFQEQYQETFKRILPRYLEGNENIGISLTGGLDGRIIIAYLPRDGVRPVCYTFAGSPENLLDSRIAAKVAAACGLKHHVLRIGADFFDQFPLHLDRTVYVTDGCLGLLGTHEAYFNTQAHRLAPVRLTGVFGGEIFREVSFYKPANFNRELLNPAWSNLLEEADGYRSSDQLHPVTRAVTREIPDRRFGVIAAGRSQTVFRTPYLDNELVALAYRTPPALRASPEPVISAIKNNSEQLSRIRTDLGFLGSDGSIGSYVRRLFEKGAFKLDYFYSEGLPNSFERFNPWLDLFEAGGVFGRHKFLQYRRWFQRDLAHFVNGKIQEVATSESELWNSAYLNRMVTEHAKGKVRDSKELNIILTLEAIERLFFQGFSTEADAPARAALFPFEQPTLHV